jgi:hypothetical protein
MISAPPARLYPRSGSFRASAFAAAIACLLAAAACDDAPPEPQPLPGDLAVRVVSPNGSEGAAVLETGDEGITELSLEEGLRAFRWSEGGLTRIVLLRDEAGEIRFRMNVDDVNSPPRLHVVEVADAANRLRADLTGYDVIVEPLAGDNP